MSNSQLDKEFGIIMDEQLGDPSVHLPPKEREKEKRDLELVRDLALEDYKSQRDILVHIEPKNRHKYLEVLRDFLNIAKDASYKIEYLDKMQQKLDLEKKKQSNKEGSKTDVPEEEGGTMSRAKLYSLK